MSVIKPIYKFNGGNPVALCNGCSVMMCYVKIEAEGDEEKYTVKSIMGSDNKEYISTPIGNEPPAYCNNCLENMVKGSLNE